MTTGNLILLAGIVGFVVVFIHLNYKGKQLAAQNRQVGAEFLASNKQKEGVVTLDSGLQYKVLQEGTGTVHPAAGAEVTVHYHGTLIDGTVFDSSVERGEPLSLPLSRVIKGWQQGVPLMVEGEKTRFYVPSELAYGNRSAGSIPPGSVLIFDIELISIGS